MRYGLISDIHSNLEALQVVLNACRQQNVERILCIGDIVGYGANPAECIAILKKLQVTSVAGNHDWAVLGKLDASYFTTAGKEAVFWTQNQLSFEDIDFLNGLELTYQADGFVLVHGSLDQPQAFPYIHDTDQASKSFGAMGRNRICFVGHTHVPEVYVKRDNEVLNINILEFEPDEACQYIVNVGSVGQPRDGNPMASYGIYDTDMNMIEVKRVSYDIQTTQQKILQAGLPETLASRLTGGR